MKGREVIRVNIHGGGLSVGIEAVKNRAAEIDMSSMEPKLEEGLKKFQGGGCNCYYC